MAKARIELRRGLRADLPITSYILWEPFFCTDTNELFVWNGTEMVPLSGDVSEGQLPDTVVLNNKANAFGAFQQTMSTLQITGGGPNFSLTTLENDSLVAASQFSAPDLDGNSASAAIYIKSNITGAGDAKNGIYIEVPNTQPDGTGSALQIQHFGLGDAVYCAVQNAGQGFEGAIFHDGGRGFLGTIQHDSPFNSILFNGLWDKASVPGYGMFYADKAPGNAFVAARRDDGQDPDQLMFSVVGTDLVPAGGITSEGSFTGPKVSATSGYFLNGSPLALTDLDGTLAQTKNAATHQFLTSYDASSGLFGAAQPAYSDLTGLPTLFSGAYADLTGKPTLPATNAGATHNFLTAYDSSTGLFTKAQPAASDITGLATVATSGAYSDLSGRPSLATIATTGKWSDLVAASADLTLANGAFNTTFNQTSAAVWTWANTTAAVGGTNQDSPIFNLKSKYFDNQASQTDTWSLQARVAGPGTGAAIGQLIANVTAYSITSNVITFTGPGSSAIPAWTLKPDGTNNGTFTVAGATGGDAFINGTYTLVAVNAGNVTAALTHANTSASVSGVTATMYSAPASLLYITHAGSSGTTGANISGVVFPATVTSGNTVKFLPIMFSGSTSLGGDGSVVQAGIGSSGGSQPGLNFYAGTSGGLFTFNGWGSSNGVPTTIGSIGFVATGFNLTANRSSDPLCLSWSGTFTNANNAGCQMGHPAAGSFQTTTGTQYGILMGAAPSGLVTDLVFRPTSGNAKFVGLGLKPKINQVVTSTGISSATISSSTAAALTVTSTTGFVAGATITVSGLVNANNTQLNGTWVIASVTTTVNITGSGWSTHTASGGESGTLAQQASGDYTAFEVDATETAVNATNKLLVDLRLGGTSKLAIDNTGKIKVPSTNTSTSATAGANGAVPSQVVGYLTVNINGTDRKIPYFAT